MSNCEASTIAGMGVCSCNYAASFATRLCCFAAACLAADNHRVTACQRFTDLLPQAAHGQLGTLRLHSLAVRTRSPASRKDPSTRTSRRRGSSSCTLTAFSRMQQILCIMPAQTGKEIDVSITHTNIHMQPGHQESGVCHPCRHTHAACPSGLECASPT